MAFFLQLFDRMDVRRPISSSKASARTAPVPAPAGGSDPQAALEEIAFRTVGRCKLRVTLRIDRSDLVLMGNLDAPASARLGWSSGGFSCGMVLGTKSWIYGSGAISGVSIGVSNTFRAERKCLETQANDLSFSVSYRPGDRDHQHGVSIVFDTSISADFWLPEYHIWIIFYNYWVTGQRSLVPRTAESIKSIQIASSASTITAIPHQMAIAALIRIRQAVVTMDLGPFKAKGSMVSVAFRALTNGETTSLNIGLGKTSLAVSPVFGGFDGKIESEYLRFETRRRSSRALLPAAEPTVLRMSIDAGDLDGRFHNVVLKQEILRFQ